MKSFTRLVVDMKTLYDIRELYTTGRERYIANKKQYSELAVIRLKAKGRADGAKLHGASSIDDVQRVCYSPNESRRVIK